MPYKLRWEGHGVYRRFFGVVSSAEFREAYEEMKGDLRYECIRYIISDYLEAEPGPDLTDTFLGRVEQLAATRVRLWSRHRARDGRHGEKMLEHVRSFESLPLAPYPEATFATVADARHGSPAIRGPRGAGLGAGPRGDDAASVRAKHDCAAISRRCLETSPEGGCRANADTWGIP